MSSLRQKTTADAIRKALEELGFEAPEAIVVQKIPFSGMWGWASPVCFQLASTERKAGQAISVGQRAQEIAEAIQAKLEASGLFSKVEAVKGYVNAYFDTGLVANQLIGDILSRQDEFGRGEAKGERVMIEYSQPNTHKAFHVGHLRNVCLGQALSNILDLAGFETVKANYPGDIGLHVIKCLWCYLRFHKGEEPDAGRGRWLGEIYAEADSRIRQGDEYRDRVVDFVREVVRDEPAGASIRRELCRRFFGQIEAGLRENRASEEWSKDLLTLLERLWTGEALEFNEFAHRPLADWMWEIWILLSEWLEQATTDSGRDPERVQGLGPLIEKYEQIGRHPELWGYAREVRDLLGRWDDKDPELLQLWEKTRRWSLDDFNRIYDELGAHFDVWFFEHEVEEEGKQIVEDLIQKGIATDQRPNGPVLVELDKKLGLKEPTYRTIVILRADGTSLYSTKDLALARRKFEKYQVDRSIYVVDVGQSLYFQQIFKVLELWGFEQAEKCYHLAYEIVRLPSGRMSSREGSVVFYDDFFAEALRKARQSVDQKRSEEQFSEIPDLVETKRSEVARSVALGAVKYGMLSVDNNKPINFDFESALSFEGQTAPYIQYAHARACRILEKAQGFDETSLNYGAVEITTSEINLFELLSTFGSEIQRAAREYKPLYLAVYLYNLAKAFSDFYRDCPVLRAEPVVRQSRLALVAATRQVLANGLRLLAIPAPEVM